MTYIEGFIVPVSTGNRDAYVKQASDVAPILREFGVERHVEAWGSDVPEGKVTDFRKAVNAEAGEDVVFSWFEYPSRAARDAANAKMMSDPRMAEIGASMPFDGKRMVVGGFAVVVEEGSGKGGFVDGMIVPVLPGQRDAYRAMAAKSAPIFREHGATRVVESIADDVSKGQVTDFYRAVEAEDGETIVFSFIEWPDKAARDAGWEKLMADERMKPEGDMPFAGPRMFWGGFKPVLDTAKVPA
jgi:uncharacterized protein YbaA (DUF1428 family)